MILSAVFIINNNNKKANKKKTHTHYQGITNNKPKGAKLNV